MFLFIIIYIYIDLLTRQFEKQYLVYTETFYVFKYHKMKKMKMNERWLHTK